jgi:hypothetical protein
MTMATTDLIPTAAERTFDLAQREAKALAASELMPDTFKGNVANCLIAMNLARRTGFDPLMVAQNLYIVHGRPAFSAAFLIACVNACGRFTPLRYKLEGEGDARSCVAHCTDKETGEVIEGPAVTIKMAREEGWSTKSGSKWKTMPELMLRYRSAAFFARTTAPEIAMGMMTADELEDIRTDRKAPGASAQRATDALHAARDVTPAPEDESQEPEIDAVDAAFGLDGGD